MSEERLRELYEQAKSLMSCPIKVKIQKVEKIPKNWDFVDHLSLIDFINLLDEPSNTIEGWGYFDDFREFKLMRTGRERFILTKDGLIIPAYANVVKCLELI